MLTSHFTGTSFKALPVLGNTKVDGNNFRASQTCTLYVNLSAAMFREGVKKKNGKKAVRLTAWVDPPSPSPEAVRKM